MAEVHEIAKARRGKCPNCSKQTVPDYRPFCSARCKTIDLGKWVTGSYRIPTDEVPDEGDLEELLRRGEEDR